MTLRHMKNFSPLLEYNGTQTFVTFLINKTAVKSSPEQPLSLSYKKGNNWVLKTKFYSPAKLYSWVWESVQVWEINNRLKCRFCKHQKMLFWWTCYWVLDKWEFLQLTLKIISIIIFKQEKTWI